MLGVGTSLKFLSLMLLVIQNEANEKVFDTYFNGFCYWSEEVSYHVHYSSGCKVYFTCQRGKFLDFHRCPESTVFNTETRECDPNAICKDRKRTNPTYDAWWEKVVDVIDDVLYALNNSSTVVETAASSTVPDTITQTAIDASATVHSSIDRSSKPFTSEVGSNPDMSQTVSTATATNSVLQNVKSDFESPVQDVTHQHIKPSVSIADSFETKQTSMHVIPMQFDTQTSVLTDNLKSSATPFPEVLKTMDQLGLPSLDSISNSTKEKNIMTDFVFPLVQDILKNDTIMAKVNDLFAVLFLTADPLLYQILDRQVDEEQGSTTLISLKELKEAWNRTYGAVRPIFKELVMLVYPVFFQRVAKSGEVILDYIENAKVLNSIPSIFRSLFNMVFKYRLLDSSNLDQFTTFSLTEIRRDFKVLSNILFSVFRNRVPWFK